MIIGKIVNTRVEIVNTLGQIVNSLVKIVNSFGPIVNTQNGENWKNMEKKVLTIWVKVLTIFGLFLANC